MMSFEPEDIWIKLAQFGVQRRFIGDNFYTAGNKLSESVLGKKSVVIFDNEDFLHNSVDKFKCHIPGCMKVFNSLMGYEEHYNTSHRYVCGTCHKRLPSPHLLDLHISETHDSYFEALAEKKPMFQCFVESCSVKCSTKKERHSHCIEVHKFPPDFRYDSFKNEPKKKKNTGAETSTKKFVPTKIPGFGHSSHRGSLGRGRRGGGLQLWPRGKPSKTAENSQEVSMTDLEEALPSME